MWLALAAVSLCAGQETTAERLIDAGHWKRARTMVEQRLREAPADPNAIYLSSQIRNAFGDHASPRALAEKAVSLDGGVARYHRQLAEVQGVMAQHAGVFQQIVLARRFSREIDAAISLDAHDVQALRDLLEFYLLAPGVLGGDARKAESVARQIGAIDVCEGFLARARIAEFRKDWTQTEAMLRAAADVHPISYKAQMTLAEFYLAPEHRDETAAEALSRAALKMDAARAGAYRLLATIYAGKASWSALDAILSEAAKAVPDDASPYYRAAERLLADGREPARAERYLRIYLAQEPEGNQPTAADARRRLGWALRAQGKTAVQSEERIDASQD